MNVMVIMTVGKRLLKKSDERSNIGFCASSAGHCKVSRLQLRDMITLLLSLYFLTGCVDNSFIRQKMPDALPADPEHITRLSSDIFKHHSTILYTGWYYLVDTPNNFKRRLDKSDEIYYLAPRPITTAKNITTLEIYESNYNDKNYYGLTMHLDKDGAESWSYATKKAQVMRLRLGFILDNRLLQVAKVNSQITNGVTALNRGDYSRKELENFKMIIESEK